MTLLFPLVEVLSIRHFMVIEDLLAHCAPPTSFLHPEMLRHETVWARIPDRFPDGADGGNRKYIFQSVVADLAGRGLISRDTSLDNASEDPPLFPSIVAKRLLAFVKDPAPTLPREVLGAAAES